VCSPTGMVVMYSSCVFLDSTKSAFPVKQKVFSTFCYLFRAFLSFFQHFTTWALFRSKKFLDFNTLAFLFLFDKHCPIIK